jgi:glycerol kinase
MSKYIMALDQGTTSSRCILFDHAGEPVGSAQRELHQFFPRDGWVEHDPDEIWRSQMEVAREAVHGSNLSLRDIAAIGIANQRETTVVWDRVTGEPVYNAIVWQCRRTAEFCDRLKAEGLEASIRAKTGLPVDAYFSATKIRWILDNVAGTKEKAAAGQLLFGTIETWLIWKMTGGRVHITDYSNAARTMLFNIHTLAWDDDILRLLEIPRAMLPEVRPSSHLYGETEPELFGLPIPIAGAAGDQQASLFGQACFEKGDAKNTYGTGCFMLMNTGETPVLSENGLLTTIAWGLKGKVSYALEGSVFVAGAAIQWLRDEMKLIDEAADSEWMAMKVQDSCGVYLVPAFVGLGAPYWNPYARGVLVGLTRAAGRNHIIRATLESLAYQSYDLLKAMEKDAGLPLASLKVDGGAAANHFLMQFQADLLDVPVRRPKCIETTARGAAWLAGLAVGYWKSRQEMMDAWQLDRDFQSEMGADRRSDLLRGWSRAVDCAVHWAREQKE